MPTATSAARRIVAPSRYRSTISGPAMMRSWRRYDVRGQRYDLSSLLVSGRTLPSSHYSSLFRRDDDENHTATTIAYSVPSFYYPSTMTMIQHQEVGRRQRRDFHSTSQPHIAPFLPEIVIATGIIGGWVACRVRQGKPLTPDDALEVQEAYRKQEEKLRQRQERWRQASDTRKV
jgi:hypothetical protein